MSDAPECPVCGERPYLTFDTAECASVDVPEADRVCVYTHTVPARVFVHGAYADGHADHTEGDDE